MEWSAARRSRRPAEADPRPGGTLANIASNPASPEWAVEAGARTTEAVQQGGLSGSARAEQCDELARPPVEVHPAQHPTAVEVPPEAADPYREGPGSAAGSAGLLDQPAGSGGDLLAAQVRFHARYLEAVPSTD